MLRTRHSRAFLLAFGVVLAASFSLVAHGAAAKPRAGKTVTDEAPGMDAPAPLRFFTINDVLAKHDGKTLPTGTRVATWDSGEVATDAMLPGMMPLTSDEPFGLFVFRAPDGVLWTKWRATREAMLVEAGQLDRCRSSEQDCSSAAERFLGIVAVARSMSGQTRIERVNLMVNNAVRYVSDFAQHGVADRWSAPLVTLAAGQGDCEDYAVLKYAALREAGVAEADLRMLLVKDRAVRQDHAVLAVRLDGRWLVLDNRRAAPLETADLGHFLPLFTLDRRGVNVFAAPYASRALHESETDVLPAADTEATGRGLPELPVLL